MSTLRGLAASLVSSVAGELVRGGEDATQSLRRATDASAKGIAKHLAAEAIELWLARMAGTTAGGVVAVEASTAAVAGAVAGGLARESGKAVAGIAARETVRFGARQLMRSAVRASAIGSVAGLVVEQGIDSIRLARGDIDKGDYGRRTVENVASAAGGFGGACAGAALGTAVLPGAGTVLGGLAGGLVGAFGAMRGLREVTGWHGGGSLSRLPA